MKTMPIYIIMSLMSVMPETAQAQTDCLMLPLRGVCQTDHINLYIGPQSVEPGEDIFIAVETLSGSLESSSAHSVTIIDAGTGQRYQADVNQGLAYIEIQAPTHSGRLIFTAQIGDVKSHTAEVLVHSAQAQSFTLFTEKNKGQLFLFSSIIADRFGNFVDDGRNVTIDLIHRSNVYSTLQTQTLNGRIGMHIDCDLLRHPQTKIRARIGEAISELPIPNYVCGG